jgi:hypothetical protein
VPSSTRDAIADLHPHVAQYSEYSCCSALVLEYPPIAAVRRRAGRYYRCSHCSEIFCGGSASCADDAALDENDAVNPKARRWSPPPPPRGFVFRPRRVGVFSSRRVAFLFVCVQAGLSDMSMRIRSSELLCGSLS